ncbi:cytochrome P450 [Phanerochaete sordida]|uniref:Cytochrome P450 n=1 Tax=Phanerochaete sordida TaxID=48140 RepID=A0A9P3G5Y6_9APHY|nr:cytochrome P450 [Phanerochaete sordida]
MSAVWYSGAGGLGILTWLALNRRSVRGDVAAAAYFCAGAALYFFLRRLPQSSGLALHTSISTMAVYTCSALVSTVAYRLSPWHPLAHVSGPLLCRLSSLWLTTISYRGRRHLAIDCLHARYGTLVRIGPNMVSVNSPSAQYIYSASGRMEKSDAYNAPGHDGVVALFFKQPVEKLHAERKRVWSRLFTSEGLSHVVPFMERRTFQLLACLERRQADSPDKLVNLETCFQHWSYDFMGDFVFGGYNRFDMMKNGDSEGVIEGGRIGMILHDSIGQTPWLLDIAWRLPFSNAMHRLVDIAKRLMDNRLEATETPSFRDLVAYLTEDGSIPKRDLHVDAIVAIQAGSDNTHITLTLAMYFMLTQPAYLELLRSQLEEIFVDPLGPLPDEKLSEVPLLDAVINEALRLGTPFFLPRVVSKGGAIFDEQFIPEDTIVVQAAYSQQIDPVNFWPDPLTFRPERWISEESGLYAKTNKSALSSFSSGAYACVGKQLAYQGLRHVLARVVLNVDMALPDGFDPQTFRDGILNIRTTILEQPLMVHVRRRGDAVPVDDI